MNWQQFQLLVEKAHMRSEADAVDAQIFHVDGDDLKGLVVVTAGAPFGSRLCLDLDRWVPSGTAEFHELTGRIVYCAVDPDAGDLAEQVIWLANPRRHELIMKPPEIRQEIWPMRLSDAG